MALSKIPADLITGGLSVDPAAPADAITVDSSGNVGVGTSSPSYKFHLVQPSSDNALVIDNGGGAGDNTNPYLAFSGTSAGSNYIRGRIRGTLPNSTDGGLAFDTGSSGSMSERARIDSSGNLLVGTTSAVGKLTVRDAADRGQSTAQFSIEGNGYTAHHFLDSVAYSIGQNSNSRNLKMYSGSNSGTGVQLAAGGTSWGTYSDERMKDIIEPITDAINKVSTLRTVIGKYKTDDADKRRSMMIAQDVQAVLPEATTEDADGMLSLAYTDLIPLLTAAIQEQQALITAQQTAIETLEARVAALEGGV